MMTPQSPPVPLHVVPMSTLTPATGKRQAFRATVATYLGNIRTRRQLLELSETQLRDIGLTRGQALREAWQPIWRMTGTPAKPAGEPVPRQDGTAYAAIG